MQRSLVATALLLWVGAGFAQTNRGGIAGTTPGFTDVSTGTTVHQTL
jgi:hypothetical protein